MNAKFVILAVVASSSLTASSVNAQTFESTAGEGRAPETRNYFEQKVAAPTRALELSVGTGYTQGFGMLAKGVGMPDVVRPGIAFDLGAAYRIDPHWAIGLTGQYQELTSERATGARGLTSGVAAAYHFAPYVRSDPWLQLGAGYRLLWETNNAPATTVLTHGFQLAKLTAGLDVRFTEDVAVSPVVGADLNVFLWQDAGNSVAISDPRVNTFVFAGVQGRFDIATAHQRESTMASAHR
jgi:hypothetical protein